MLVRCKLDGLLLDAFRHPSRPTLIALDGDEPFEMERLEAAYYELVSAASGDLEWLQQAGYRTLNLAADFEFTSRRLQA